MSEIKKDKHPAPQKEENLLKWREEIGTGMVKDQRNYNLEDIYEHAHSELSLQQSKRDQIITIYLALCSFLLPFALGESVPTTGWKGLLFVLLGVVGILFSLITVRYREYKEVYWICCQTLTVLQSFKPEKLDKTLIQRTFYYSLHKKGKGFLHETTGRLQRGKFVKKNLNSSETFHYMIIVLMASFINGLGVAFLCLRLGILGIAAGVIVGLAVLAWLMSVYFNTCIKIYKVLEEPEEGKEKEKDDAFRSAFSKAWFLHMYYDEATPEETNTETEEKKQA